MYKKTRISAGKKRGKTFVIRILVTRFVPSRRFCGFPHCGFQRTERYPVIADKERKIILIKREVTPCCAQGNEYVMLESVEFILTQEFITINS